MSTNPLLTYELVVVHDRELAENAAEARFVSACGASSVLQTTARVALSGVGSLLIAAGERLGGVRVPRTPDLVGAAR
jgi:hypothetical protein